MANASEKSIFFEALEKGSSEERERYLTAACVGKPELRAEVDALLRAHERTGNLLDSAPPGILPAASSDSGQARDRAASPAETLGYSPIAERPGSVIGPYKLMEQIGEGGFGLVFVAEQQQPVRRKVALKIIKPGMDTRDVIARFEHERQAVALMQHPNIAQVYDAGTTDAGRPYFVMELVRGLPVTEFCDQRRLATRERLELFVHVCHAVQHAHQKGVVHRDLKPSNVLVTLHDPGGPGVPKVIDFGVAKAIGQSLTDKTIYTRFAAMIGTPLYMSPEQAELTARDVDTRSDVYSLGVLLYELLTGTTPFDRERLQTATFDELRRIIREEEPPRPSTRLTTLGESLATVSAQHGTESTMLPRIIRGDLDWIVMKAIEKDRERRYETASALAADVRRFLKSEPIEARPPSPVYRFRKFARRNKAAITTVSIVAAALVLGTAISGWQWARAVAERDEKDRARLDAIQARNEADDARKNIEQFAERLKEANVLVSSGRSHADAGRWSAANADYTRATELEPNYYLVWIERGSLYVRLGLWQLAAADYARAFQLGTPADSPGWWGVPQLFLYCGDEKTYRQACEQMLRAADESAAGLSLNGIRTCLLASTPPVDPVSLAEQAEKLLTASPFAPPEHPFGDRAPPPRESPLRERDPVDVPGPPAGPVRRFDPDRPDGPGRPEGLGAGRALDPGQPPHPGGPGGRDEPGRFGVPGGSPMRQFGANFLPRGASLHVAGWAHHRAGQYESAIERLGESITEPWPGRGVSLPVLAMAYHRAGRGDDAREALAAAEKLIDQWTEQIASSPVGGRLPIPWFDWIECLVTYREAKILITGFAPADDPRLRAAQERSLSAIRDAVTSDP